jgi:signal transduction histidine kinase
VGHLLVLRLAEQAAAIDAAFHDAAHSRGLASVSRDLAHDIRGSLNLVSMNAEILSCLPDTHRESRERAVVTTRSADAIRRGLRRVDRALEVILDRGVTGPHDKPSRFDIRVICQALADLVEARAHRQRVEMVLHLGGQPAEALGFADRVHAALLSLLVNVLDAMPEGGTLRIDIEQTSWIRVCVSDTGRGIGAGTTDEIWRLDRSPGLRGTGIGLYVTQAVAAAHGGRASYHPNVNAGACFVLELPAAPTS